MFNTLIGLNIVELCSTTFCRLNDVLGRQKDLNKFGELNFNFKGWKSISLSLSSLSQMTHIVDAWSKNTFVSLKPYNLLLFGRYSKMSFKWNSLQNSLCTISMKDDYFTSLIYILSNKRSLINSYKCLLLYTSTVSWYRYNGRCHFLTKQPGRWTIRMRRSEP